VQDRRGWIRRSRIATAHFTAATMEGNSKRTPIANGLVMRPPRLAATGSMAARCSRKARAVPISLPPSARCNPRHQPPGKLLVCALSGRAPEWPWRCLLGGYSTPDSNSG
jgi:hypothetical protein